ncbi:hypothetical protein [Enterococcus sp. AZ103]|uniref:hypothetical protein n=1 Tax=Enterococcus sp. AZ103 TaxID=2774628 RepID=UPI003F29717A
MSQSYDEISNQEQQDALELIKKLQQSIKMSQTDLKQTTEPERFFELYQTLQADQFDYDALLRDYPNEEENFFKEATQTIVSEYLKTNFEKYLSLVQATTDATEKSQLANQFKATFYPYINLLDNGNIVDLAGMYEALTLF